MNLEGNLKPGQQISGNINSLSVLTISAYGIAVKHGFKGTEEEWLRSLEANLQTIQRYVNEYLEQNPTTVDTTLSNEGEAADAKATGKAIAEAKTEALEHTDAHANMKNNPHNVTAEQLGLENVDNTSDMDKPVSTAQAVAIADAKKAGTDAQKAAENAETNAKAHANTASQAAETNAKAHANTVSQTAESNAKSYADSKHKEFTATIPASNWYNLYGSVYQNELPVVGLLGTDKVDVDVFMPDHSTEAMENNLKIDEEFSKIFHIPYGDGTMWIRAREKPEVDIPIKIKVVR